MINCGPGMNREMETRIYKTKIMKPVLTDSYTHCSLQTEIKNLFILDCLYIITVSQY